MADDLVIRWADCVPTLWKNGGGTTREVAAHPSTGDEFDWRLSIADVDRPGPFSAFPGVDRVITLLEGEQMVLDFEHEQARLSPLEPYAFAGEAACECTLPSGPTRDFNVMTRRGRVDADVQVHDTPEAISLAAVDGERLVVALVDNLRASASGKQWTLARYDTLRSTGALELDAGTSLEIILR